MSPAGGKGSNDHKVFTPEQVRARLGVEACYHVSMALPSRLTAEDGYAAFLTELKDRIRTARLRAALSVNQELILLYWSIGRDILERQAAQGWGARIIDRLAQDLRRDLPDTTGFSARNLKYMRAFAGPIPTGSSCNRLLHYCPGVITSD